MKFQGDSGGPLNCQVSGSNDEFQVCGIVSFGKLGACGVVKPGKKPTYPVYTNVGFYKDWINESTGGIAFHFLIVNIQNFLYIDGHDFHSYYSFSPLR